MTPLRSLRTQPLGAFALVVALSGTAYAAGLPRNSVGTAQLQNGAVTSAKLKDKGVTKADLAPRAVTPAAVGVPLTVRVEMDQSAVAPTHAPDDHFAAVPFEVERVDTGRLWTPSAPARIRIPRAGVWLLQAQASFTQSSAGVRTVAIASPATSADPGDFLVSAVGAPSPSCCVTSSPLSATVVLAAGETVGLQTYQNSGDDLNIEVLAGTWLSATYLGSAP